MMSSSDLLAIWYQSAQSLHGSGSIPGAEFEFFFFNINSSLWYRIWLIVRTPGVCSATHLLNWPYISQVSLTTLNTSSIIRSKSCDPSVNANYTSHWTCWKTLSQNTPHLEQLWVTRYMDSSNIPTCNMYTETTNNVWCFVPNSLIYRM